MGTKGNGERSTICGEGCAMTSLSMVLASLQIPSPYNGSTFTLFNPGLFNMWLENNQGYECLDGDCNNLILNIVSQLNTTVQLIGELSPPSISTIENGIDSGLIAFLAHVQNRSHFVLLTNYVGTGSGNFTVNDPYYNMTNYMYQDISDIIMYALLQ
jgi:hypothetical protein